MTINKSLGDYFEFLGVGKKSTVFKKERRWLEGNIKTYTVPLIFYSLIDNNWFVVLLTDFVVTCTTM